MSDIEIITYDQSLREGVIDYRGRSYEVPFPESREYLHWKYECNPYLTEPIYYLARAEGRIVGMRGVYGTRWEFGAGRTAVTLPCADDFAVDPEYRNRGVMSMIMREALPDLARRGFDYVINTSAGRITAMSSLAAGWRSAGAVEPLVRRTRDEWVRHRVRNRMRKTRFVWRLVPGSGATIVSSPKPLQRVDRMEPVTTHDRGVITASRDARAPEMADLVARLPYDGRIRHVRDTTYLAWRYRNPIRQYRFFYYERDGRLEGYLVLGRYVECQLPTLPYQMVDWEGSSEAVRAELLRLATRVANIPALGAWAAGYSSADRAIMQRAGFVPTDLDARKRGLPCILVKNLHPGVAPESWILGDASIIDPQRWDMRLIYTTHG